MRSIIQYAEEEQRTFEELPFNSVDAVILSHISYFHWELVIGDYLRKGSPCPPKILIRDLPAKEAAIPLIERIASPDECFLLYEAIRVSQRFSLIELTRFHEIEDLGKEEQFAAVTCNIDDEMAYISYRGTNGTFVGWKEDFNMAAMFPVGCQADALSYLLDAAKHLPKKIKLLVGGHSKGGNCAMYAATYAPLDVQKRIEKVYSFDGPGYKIPIHELPEYEPIRDKVEHYIPKASLVGQLLEIPTNHKIVESTSMWLSQHDPFTWYVGATDFIYASEVSPQAEIRVNTVNAWVATLSDEKRRAVADTIYHIVQASRTENVFEISDTWRDKANSILEATKSIDAKTKENIIDTIRILVYLNLKEHRKKGLALPKIPSLKLPPKVK